LPTEDAGVPRDSGADQAIVDQARQDQTTDPVDATISDLATMDQGPWTAPGVQPPLAEVFCGEPTGPDVSVDLAAGDGVVWLLVASSRGWSVYSHDDGGYRTVASGEEASVRQLAVAPDGRVWVMPLGACAVAEVSSGMASCEFMRVSGDEAVVGMAVVSDEQQWVVLGRRIVVGRSNAWGDFREFAPGPGVVYRDVWGDPSFLALPGDGIGVAFFTTFSAFWAAPGVPPGGNSRVSGTDRSHLWFGSDSGRILHFDEPSWTVRRPAGSRPGCADPVRGIWADSQTSAFSITDRALTRLPHGGGEQTVLAWDCSFTTTMDAITGMSTRGAPEVFVAAVDRSRMVDGCGPVVLLRYDGTDVHRM
jgi:hypothetical protein